MLKINTNKQEIEYKGLFFPFKAVKTLIKKTIPEEQYLRFCIHRHFNKNTGQIERKFAWDSVFQSLHDGGTLTPVLDNIIHEEYLK